MDLSTLPEAVGNRVGQLANESPIMDDLTGLEVGFLEHHGMDARAKLGYIVATEGHKPEADWWPECIAAAATAIWCIFVCQEAFEQLTGNRPAWALQIEVDRLRPSRN